MHVSLCFVIVSCVLRSVAVCLNICSKLGQNSLITSNLTVHSTARTHLRYSSLTINLCFGPRYHLTKFGLEFFCTCRYLHCMEIVPFIVPKLMSFLCQVPEPEKEGSSHFLISLNVIYFDSVPFIRSVVITTFTTFLKMSKFKKFFRSYVPLFRSCSNGHSYVLMDKTCNWCLSEKYNLKSVSLNKQNGSKWGMSKNVANISRQRTCIN